jgi:dephospho-CoA kinase
MIIGLIGQKRVGKDTVANMLKNIDAVCDFKCMALADPIKDISRIMFNFTEEQLYDDAKDIVDPKWGIKPRDFFEQFGTNIMQFDIYKYLPNLESQVEKRLFWVHSLLAKLKDYDYNKNSNIIVTDVRGLHEIYEINKFTEGKAIFIRIVKEQKYNININNNINNNITSSHITQREPNEIPDEYIFNTINNNGTLEELKTKVKNVWKRIEDINLI